MINVFTVDDSLLNKGMLLLRQQFKNRGWKAKIPYIGSPHCFIDRGDGNTIHIFATTPPTTSYAAAHLANDKFATYQLLKTISVNQPETVVADASNLQDAKQLLAKHGQIVVKPADAGHGKGITVGVKTEDQLTKAVDLAISFNKSSSVVVAQQQFNHPNIHDLRLACINNKFIGAINRIPARVEADGKHTVGQLIELENTSGKRGQPYYAPLAYIDTQQASGFLGSEISKVYPVGQQVQVMSVANYGAGGEIHDVTDQIPAWMIKSAEDISRVMQLAVCGVDFMTNIIPESTMTKEQIESVVIEVNKAPSLAIHDMPTTGKSRGAVATYVDYLASI